MVIIIISVVAGIVQIGCSKCVTLIEIRQLTQNCISQHLKYNEMAEDSLKVTTLEKYHKYIQCNKAENQFKKIETLMPTMISMHRHSRWPVKCWLNEYDLTANRNICLKIGPKSIYPVQYRSAIETYQYNSSDGGRLCHNICSSLWDIANQMDNKLKRRNYAATAFKRTLEMMNSLYVICLTYFLKLVQHQWKSRKMK